MQTITVTERQIIYELQNLEPEKWSEVLDFIGYLKHRKTATKKGPASLARFDRPRFASVRVGRFMG